jgi:hypothetical protein
VDRIDYRPGGRHTEHDWHVFGAPSNYVFISYSPADRLRSIVERAEKLGSAVGNDALMLVDTSEQIQAVLQERWLASTELPNDIDLYAFVLTPGLAHRLGAARPRRAIGSGLYEIHLTDPFVFEDKPSFEMVFRKLIESLLQTKFAVRAQSAERYMRSHESEHSADSNGDVGKLIGLRKRLRESVPMLDSEQWGRWRGVSTNPSATLAKYREQGRLFSVREGRNYLYPRFQFTQDAAPLDAVADILNVVPEDARGWPLLSWFEAPSALLGGRKPSDVIPKDPASVRNAAADFYADD